MNTKVLKNIRHVLKLKYDSAVIRQWSTYLLSVKHITQQTSHAKKANSRQSRSLNRRFATHKNLYADLSYFDLKRFSETIFHGIPISVVNMICNLFPNKTLDSPV